jgi:hypothetical protein
LSAHRLQAQLGARDSLKADLDAQPRALQVTLVVTRDGILEAGGRPITLTPGVWAVQLASDGAGQVSLKNAGGTSFLLHRIRALGVQPERPIQIEQLAYGAALITQSVEGNRLEYKLALLRPPGDEAVYRLGIHIVDIESPHLYGVWSLDLTNPKSFQRGALAIDLAERTAEASVRNAYAGVEVGPQEVEVGEFQVQVVWWRRSWPAFLSLTSTAQFHRDRAGGIQWGSASQPPLVILAVP